MYLLGCLSSIWGERRSYCFLFGLPAHHHLWPPPSPPSPGAALVPSAQPFWSWTQIPLFKWTSLSVGAWLSAVSPLIIQSPFTHWLSIFQNCVDIPHLQAVSSHFPWPCGFISFFVCYLSYGVVLGSKDKQMFSNCHNKPEVQTAFHHENLSSEVLFREPFKIECHPNRLTSTWSCIGKNIRFNFWAYKS